MAFACPSALSARSFFRIAGGFRRGLARCLFAAALASAQTIPFSETHGARIIGRTESTPDGQVLNWSGTALEVGFTGNQVRIRFGYDRAIFQASLDGVPLRDLVLVRNGYWWNQLLDTSVTFSVAGSPSSNHLLRLTKRSAAFRNNATDPAGLATVREIIGTAGSLPPRRPRRIEFLGNSATAGVGVRDSASLSTTKDVPLTIHNDDFQDASSGLVAEFFGAEVHVVAVGGRGLWRNVPGCGTENMAQTYRFNTLRLPSTNWDFTRWRPDLVVVELGSNDFGASNTVEIDTVAWKARWIDLLDGIHQAYGDVAVLLVNGPNANDHYPVRPNKTPIATRTILRNVLQRVVAWAGSHGFSHARYVELSEIQPTGWGAGWHSNTVQSRRNAYELEEAIAQLMRWETPTSLAGRILSENGAPVPRARVDFLSLDGTPVRRATTDDQGEYLLDTAFGHAALRVGAPGHRDTLVSAGSRREIRLRRGSTPPRALRIHDTDFVEEWTMPLGAVARFPATLKGIAVVTNVWTGTSSTVRNMLALFDSNDVRKLSERGANVFTFYLDWNWFGRDADSSMAWARMDSLCTWASRHGMRWIPSLVVYPNGVPRGGPGFFSDQAAIARTVGFWSRLARRFQGRAEIAGFDILNEPRPTDDWNDSLRLDTLVDSIESLVGRAVRKQDSSRILFLEPQMWSDAGQLKSSLPGPVAYISHFYQPLPFTAQGFGWISNGGYPTKIPYPNTSLTYWAPTVGRYDTAFAVTGSWSRKTMAIPIPPGVDWAFPWMGNPNTSVELQVDSVMFRRPPRFHYQGWVPVWNGGFQGVSIGGLPLVPAGWSVEGGAFREGESESGKNQVVRLAKKTGPKIGRILAGDGDAPATRSAIRVSGWDTLRVSYLARIRPSIAKGLARQPRVSSGVRFAKDLARTYDRDSLAKDLATAVLSKRNRFRAPVLVGEFAPSRLGPTKSDTTYLRDMIDLLARGSVSWTFYHYREIVDVSGSVESTWPLGWFNDACWKGAPTWPSCTVEDPTIGRILQDAWNAR